MRLKVWKSLVNEPPKAHWQAKERFAREATPEMTGAIARLRELGWRTMRFEWQKGKPARFFVERNSAFCDAMSESSIGVIDEEMVLFWHLKQGCFFVESRVVFYSSMKPKSQGRRRLYRLRGKAKPFRL